MFTVADRNGLRLHRSDGKSSQRLAEANKFLSGIAIPEQKLIEFTSLSGRRLKAVLVLRYNYRPGDKVPLVTEIYPGAIVNPNWFTVPTGYLDLYASAGYALMQPSIPDDDSDEDTSNPIALMDSVMPAVDKVVSEGYADPDRLFVQGGSQGGWATLWILTLTKRFKADRAWAMGTGHSLFSGCGSLHRGFVNRYFNHNDLVTPNNLGCGGRRVSEVPWWRDADRRRRSDPFSYVDRVETPLMLVHGDLDQATSDTTSEEFFKALVSMRKPAKFVRYFGEAHIITQWSAANYRDAMMRTFAWYDQWGDIARDENGKMIWHGDRVKGRNGGPPLKLEDYAKFDLFQLSPPRQRDATRD